MRKHFVALFVVATFFFVGHAASVANAFTDVYVFGDSLSDSGALAVLSPGNCPPPPYAGCRFSNGPVWVENLATSLGLSASTAYAGGTNYAIGGQRSDQILGGQIPLFSSNVGGVADSSALYVIWGGGNDYLQAFDPTVAANNIVSSVLALSALGATDFLVPNLPVVNAFGSTFNSVLAAGLAALVGPNVFLFDALSLFIDITINPGAYGFTNATTPCYVSGVACATPDDYVLWDAVHPTAAAHVVLGAEALALIPEPGTALLVGVGLALLASARRTRAG